MLRYLTSLLQITEYWSYEHFYVIYIHFWKLDTDHDLFITKQQLIAHADHSKLPCESRFSLCNAIKGVSIRALDRIFECGGHLQAPAPMGQMSYSDFVWFILSDEVKQ